MSLWQEGRAIRKTHCITAISSLTNTDILMICVIKLLAQSLSRALACVLLLGQLMMSPIFCYVAPITADMASWWQDTSSLSSSQPKSQMKQTPVVCKAIDQPSVSHSSMDAYRSDPRPEHLKPWDKFAAVFPIILPACLRQRSGQHLLIYVPKNFLTFWNWGIPYIFNFSFLKRKGMCMWLWPLCLSLAFITISCTRKTIFLIRCAMQFTDIYREIDR